METPKTSEDLTEKKTRSEVTDGDRGVPVEGHVEELQSEEEETQSCI